MNDGKQARTDKGPVERKCRYGLGIEWKCCCVVKGFCYCTKSFLCKAIKKSLMISCRLAVLVTTINLRFNDCEEPLQLRCVAA